ncbi:MAG: hypothetical protein KatS3mg118_1776 [Paracoccaceae bacterium]|nr:MAG: DUF1150 family protein [Alphaproteobacteria bacterium]GIX13817.1 MAG: hypothetical protein KatS3mg118_1776 [Paracoccaceae bacterium]
MDTAQKDEGRQPAPVVYVKGVRAEDLPAGIQIPKGIKMLYAIHGENGEPLALVGDRRVAFAVARQNSYRPVSVH